MLSIAFPLLLMTYHQGIPHTYRTLNLHIMPFSNDFGKDKIGEEFFKFESAKLRKGVTHPASGAECLKDVHEFVPANVREASFMALGQPCASFSNPPILCRAVTVRLEFYYHSTSYLTKRGVFAIISESGQV